MLRFFRQIRQRLLTENRFSKYLLYAVGEIMLVVIGILIALQVDNWNEDRKILNREILILNDIRDEIEGNIPLLKTVIEQDELSFNANEELLKIIDDDDLFSATNDSVFSRLIWRMNVTWTYEPELGTLNSVINSGKIEYISNKQLKSRLTSLEAKIKDAIEGTIYVTNLRTPLFYEQLSENYAYKNKGWVLEKEKFWNSKTYFWLYRFNRFKGGAISEEKGLLDYFQQTLEKIDDELNK
jgi:hypothetical protein